MLLPLFLSLFLTSKFLKKNNNKGGIVVVHSKQQLYLYDDARNVMRQVALGHEGENEENVGTAALLPAEGGAAGGGAAAAAASSASGFAATLGGLGGLGGLGPQAAGGGARGVGSSRAGEINLAEGDAMVCVF